MKLKSESIIYKFEKGISKITKLPIIGFSTKTSKYKTLGWMWRGLVTEEQVKQYLSNKQFQEWKQGKRNKFEKHLTTEERKSILKNNNKKK